MHLLDTVLPPTLAYKTKQGADKRGSPVNVMLTLTIILLSVASDKRKGYCHKEIALPSFVMDLLFWLPRELLSSHCLPSSLSHITTEDCFMGNRQDSYYAGELDGIVWVFAFGWEKEKENRKLSQNSTRFTSITLIVKKVFKNL